MEYQRLLMLSKLGLCAVGLCAAYWVYWEITVGIRRRNSIKQYGCKPAAQLRNSDPLFGLDLIFQYMRWLREHKMLEQQQQQFYTRLRSNTLVVKILRRPLIFTIEVENIKTILAQNFDLWGVDNSRQLLVPLLGEGIFSANGSRWRHSRDLLRPVFVRSQLNDLSMLEHHVADLIEAIPRDGSTVDLQELFPRFTLDVATELLFGQSTNDLSPNSKGENADFIAAFNRCLDVMGGNSTWGIFSLLVPNPAFKRDCRLIHEYVDSIVENAVFREQKHLPSESPSAEPSRYILLRELISQTNDRVKIRSELLNILFAGRDTTASFLSNLWFTLANYPKVFTGLRHEVDSTFPNRERPVSFEQLKDMKYLRAVLNESLRLYPIVPMNNRTALSDTTLPLGGGDDGQSPIFVPKGQLVTWDVYSLHRRKDIYGDDAGVFRPERWLDSPENKGLRPGWAYLPFHGGPRTCIGQQFALTEASYVTVRLMQEFASIESRDSDPWRELFTLTCTGLGGCKVALYPLP